MKLPAVSVVWLMGSICLADLLSGVEAVCRVNGVDQGSDTAVCSGSTACISKTISGCKTVQCSGFSSCAYANIDSTGIDAATLTCNGDRACAYATVNGFSSTSCIRAFSCGLFKVNVGITTSTVNTVTCQGGSYEDGNVEYGVACLIDTASQSYCLKCEGVNSCGKHDDPFNPNINLVVLSPGEYGDSCRKFRLSWMLSPYITAASHFAFSTIQTSCRRRGFCGRRSPLHGTLI